MDTLTDPIAISNPGADERTKLPLADPYVPLSYADLKPAADAPRAWLWQGYLLPGAVTMLTSLWKSGKSTLLSVLLSRLKTGGELAGLPVRVGRAVVVSEETPELWWERGRTLALDGHVQWFCKPFQGKPTTEQWLDLLDQLGRMHDRQPVDLLAIDSLANLASMRTENDAAEMLKALAPLQPLTSRGVSVLLCHHPRKGAVHPGQAARGSGALSGYVDIILEMLFVCRRNPQDRRRRLRAYSRYSATPLDWVIEWTADEAPTTWSPWASIRRAGLRARLAGSPLAAGECRETDDTQSPPARLAGLGAGAGPANPVEVARSARPRGAGAATRSGHAQGSVPVLPAGHDREMAGELPRGVHPRPGEWPRMTVRGVPLPFLVYAMFLPSPLYSGERGWG